MAGKVIWYFYDSLTKSQSNPIATADAQNVISKMTPEMLDRLFIWTEGWKNWQQVRSYLKTDQNNFSSPHVQPSPEESFETKTIPVGSDDEVTKSRPFYDSNSTEHTSAFSDIRLEEETVSRVINEDHSVGIHDFDGDDIDWSKVQKPKVDFSRFSKKSMGSREARHDLKIEILLISNKNISFRSHSKNISLSGILLADTIPFDFYDSDFEVVIINTIHEDPRKSRVKLRAKAIGNNGGLTQRMMFQKPTQHQKNSLKILLEDYLNQKKKKIAG